MSRTAYVHEAVLLMEDDADDRAPGAAVTVSLCGSWEHDGPCPLAPHHTTAVRDGDRLAVRVLFAVEEEQEQPVRRRIQEALAGGRLTGPDGDTSAWRLLSDGPAEVVAEEAAHASRLVTSD